MTEKLLIQSKRGNWCIYHRGSRFIPLAVLISAYAIYNCNTKEYIKFTQGGSFIPEDIDNLPVATNVLNKAKFVLGIVFDFDYIGMGCEWNQPQL